MNVDFDSEISQSTSDSDLYINPSYNDAPQRPTAQFIQLRALPERRAPNGASDGSDGSGGSDETSNQGTSICKHLARVRYIFLFYRLFELIWFLTHEANPTSPTSLEWNKPLFSYTIAVGILLASRQVKNIWSYLGKHHYPQLLAGRTRRRLNYGLMALNWILDFAIAIYLWAQLEHISVGGGEIGDISRSFLEFDFYCSISSYSLQLVVLSLCGLFFLIFYRPAVQAQRAKAGAVAADKSAIKNQTSLTKLSEIMAKELLDAAPNCVICMEDYEIEDNIRKLGCGHFYHQGCIDQWLKKSSICPNCRQPIANARDLRGQMRVQNTV